MALVKRRQIRLSEYDYGEPGAYFVTICAAERKQLFWSTVGAGIARPQDVPLSRLGAIVDQAIKDIPCHYSGVSVDHYVIMSDHIHLLLRINADDGGRPMVAPTVSRIVQQMKGCVSKKAGFSVWQKGFYDHVVRSQEDYLEIWNYIEQNPQK